MGGDDRSRRSPDLAGITFTGSTGTGKRVALSSIEHNRKFQLEMGGKNPFVVLDDAIKQQALAAMRNQLGQVDPVLGTQCHQ